MVLFDEVLNASADGVADESNLCDGFDDLVGWGNIADWFTRDCVEHGVGQGICVALCESGVLWEAEEVVEDIVEQQAWGVEVGIAGEGGDFGKELNAQAIVRGHVRDGVEELVDFLLLWVGEHAQLRGALDIVGFVGLRLGHGDSFPLE